MTDEQRWCYLLFYVFQIDLLTRDNLAVTEIKVLLQAKTITAIPSKRVNAGNDVQMGIFGRWNSRPRVSPLSDEIPQQLISLWLLQYWYTSHLPEVHKTHSEHIVKINPIRVSSIYSSAWQYWQLTLNMYRKILRFLQLCSVHHILCCCHICQSLSDLLNNWWHQNDGADLRAWGWLQTGGGSTDCGAEMTFPQ